ncbi:MAG: hypothetical protein ABSH28_21175, partial [Acidobacteriota bacterium]
IFSRYMTVRRRGLLLGAATYGTAGVLGLVLGTWWPLLAGFATAWILRRAGADPPTDLRLDLPTIERADVSNDARVREYLRWWLANDAQVSLVASRLVREAWQRGLRRPTCVLDDDSWAGSAADEAWLRKVTADIRSLATASRHDFRAHLDEIDALSTQTLMAAGEATDRYELPPTPPDFDTVAKQIHSTTELRAYAQSYVADAILSARLRVLAWTYQHWHGERYELPHKRLRR